MLTSKKILVTGGAGFIGSELVRKLIKAKHEVTVLDNLSFGKKSNLPSGIKFIHGNLLKENVLHRALTKTYDWVFHLAALHFIPYCNEHPKETVLVNIEGTRKLLEKLSQKPPQKLFFASTAAVYNLDSSYHKEDELPDPMDIYGLSKLTGEFLVKQFHFKTQVPCVMGRLFNAYGPRETNPHLIPEIIQQLKKGLDPLELGNLTPYREYMHTSEMVDCIQNLMNQIQRGIQIVNISSGQEFSVKEVVQIFSKILGQPLPMKSRQNLKRKLERAYLRANLDQLKKQIRFKPRLSLKEGLQMLLEEEGLYSP